MSKKIKESLSRLALVVIFTLSACAIGVQVSADWWSSGGSQQQGANQTAAQPPAAAAYIATNGALVIPAKTAAQIATTTPVTAASQGVELFACSNCVIAGALVYSTGPAQGSYAVLRSTVIATNSPIAPAQ